MSMPAWETIKLPVDQVAGLPIHPLIVHGVVVLVPLATLGVLVMASSGHRSNRYSPAVLLVAFVAVVSAFLARISGEQFRDKLGIGANAKHFTYGDWMPWAALVLFGCVVVLAIMDKQGGGRRNLVGTAVAVGSVLVAIAATVLVVLTGHSGATLVWG